MMILLFKIITQDIDDYKRENDHKEKMMRKSLYKSPFFLFD